MNTKHNQRGQSMAELLATLALFIVPFFYGMSYLAQAGEAANKTHHAARYSAWERNHSHDPGHGVKADSLSTARANNRIVRRLPPMPFPEDEQVVVVAEYMHYNGVPMSAYKIVSNKTPDKFLTFYQELWSREQENGMPGHHLLRRDGMRLLSRLEEDALFTVQVQSAPPYGSRVTLGVSLLPSMGKISPPDPGFPLMSQARVLNDIAHIDEGMQSRTLRIEVGSSVRSAVHFYQKRLADSGWRQTEPSAASNYPAKPGNHHALLFSKGRQEIQMAFSRANNKTYIVALVQGI